MPLDSLDQQDLKASVGYLELGMAEEANTELEEIDPFCRHFCPPRLARCARLSSSSTAALDPPS